MLLHILHNLCDLCKVANADACSPSSTFGTYKDGSWLSMGNVLTLVNVEQLVFCRKVKCQLLALACIHDAIIAFQAVNHFFYWMWNGDEKKSWLLGCLPSLFFKENRKIRKLCDLQKNSVDEEPGWPELFLQIHSFSWNVCVISSYSKMLELKT